MTGLSRLWSQYIRDNRQKPLSYVFDLHLRLHTRGGFALYTVDRGMGHVLTIVVTQPEDDMVGLPIVLKKKQYHIKLG